MSAKSILQGACRHRNDHGAVAGEDQVYDQYLYEPPKPLPVMNSIRPDILLEDIKDH